MIKKIKAYLLFLILGLIMIAVFINTENIKTGALEGLILSSTVIIPALFPLMVLTTFLGKIKILSILPIRANLKLPLEIFILSSFGGYPTGAKILMQEYSLGKISEKSARKLAFCCVNSGPAFAVLTIGAGLLGSRELGIILWFSQILPNAVIFAAIIPTLCKEKVSNDYREIKLGDAFVDSVSDASASMLAVCGFITIGSVMIKALSGFGVLTNLIHPIIYLIEISNSITKVKNVYFLAFILGFGGLAVILQVKSILRKLEISLIKFLFFRLIFAFSTLTTFTVLIKIFKVKLPISTLGAAFSKTSTPSQISVLLIVTAICFIASITPVNLINKNFHFFEKRY